MHNILIVEDHALIRYGLKTAFETKDFISGIFEAASAEEAINIVKDKKIDVVIMDLGLPLMNGIDATKAIKSIKKDIKVIVLTSHITQEEVINSIKAGARAYCSKDINPESLTNVVSSVIKGALWFDPKVADIVINALSNENKLLNNEKMEIYNFTDREKDVIEYLCEGLTNSEISKILDVSINTVKVHVSSIIQKLGVEDRTGVVVKAFKHFKND